MKRTKEATTELCTICNQHKHQLHAPPYWRSGGAILHLEMALDELRDAIERLIVIHRETDKLYDKLIRENGGEELADDDERSFEIFDPLMTAEDPVKFKADLASLMNAIEAEDQLNMFCFFNLPQDMAQSIERLSPPEKLLVAAAAVGKPGVKQTAIFEGVKRLSNWRNAFAHGHCVDRTTKSLRHNHLIHPKEFPGVPKYISNMRDLVRAFLRLSDYLRKISVNDYTRRKSTNVESVRKLLSRVCKYQFNGDMVYSITVAK